MPETVVWARLPKVVASKTSSIVAIVRVHTLKSLLTTAAPATCS